MTDDLDKLLDRIAAHAPALRAAGLSALKLGDITIGKLSIGALELELRAADLPEPAPGPVNTAAIDAAAASRRNPPANPLDDPDSYPGGVVPRLGSQRPSAKAERDEHDDDDDE